MKIAVLSNDRIALNIRGYKIHSFTWKDIGGKEINFRDYDGIVLDARSLSGDASGLDWGVFRQILNYEVTKDVLFRDDGFIYVLGSPFVTDNSYGENIANLLGLNLEQIVGRGDSINKGKHYDNSPYVDYLEKVKSYPYSFSPHAPTSEISREMEKYGIETELAVTNYLMTRAGYSIAAEIGVEAYTLTYNGYKENQHPLYLGKIVLLPPVDIKLSEILKLLLANKHDTETNVQPEWAMKIVVHGQDEVERRLAINRKASDELAVERQDLTQDKVELRQPLEILYKAGRPLEKAVKAVFIRMGLQVIEPESSEKVEFYLAFDETKFVIEVKSTTNATIDQKGLRQVMDWQMDAFDDTGEDYKALVIASVQYDKPLAERSGAILPDNLLQYSRKKDIAVVSVRSLFEASQDIERGSTTTAAFVEKLRTCAGLFDESLNKETAAK